MSQIAETKWLFRDEEDGFIGDNEKLYVCATTLSKWFELPNGIKAICFTAHTTAVAESIKLTKVTCGNEFFVGVRRKGIGVGEDEEIHDFDDDIVYLIFRCMIQAKRTVINVCCYYE